MPDLGSEQRARELAEAIHADPETAGHEVRTARRVWDACAAIGADVTGSVGGYGVIAVLGAGRPVVAVRAELDALQADGGALHLCGHDVHTAAVVGMLATLAEDRESWTGTVVAIFQPAEEDGTGAAAMDAAGIAALVPRPDVLLAQHLAPMPLDAVVFRPDEITGHAEQWVISMNDLGGHPGLSSNGSLVRAAGRLLSDLPAELGVVTSATVGTAANAIASSATVTIDIRGTSTKVVDDRVATLRGWVERYGTGALRTSMHRLARFLPAINSRESSNQVYREFSGAAQTCYLAGAGSATADDVGVLAKALSAPLVYWFWGAYPRSDFAEEDIALLAAGGVPACVPPNHSPAFSPAPEALTTGISNLLIASSAWLSPGRFAAGEGQGKGSRNADARAGANH